MTQELAGGSTWMNAMLQVARKEVLQHIRTKRLIIIGALLLFAMAMVTIVFGVDITKGFDVREQGISSENFLLVIFLQFGGLLFIQLLPIVLTSDAVCSEWSSRTIFLLLSKPVSRSAFVVGKFVGSVLTIAATMILLLGLDYAVMQPLYTGSPTGEEVIGFLAALGFLILGTAALAALALFFSTITRSTALAVLMTLGIWLIGFKLLGLIGFFITLGQEDPSEKLAVAFSYIDPSSDLGYATQLLVPEDLGQEFSGGGDLGWAALALVIHIVLWFGLSLLVVKRRNFE